jgi:hypothetical protein
MTVEHVVLDDDTSAALPLRSRTLRVVDRGLPVQLGVMLITSPMSRACRQQGKCDGCAQKGQRQLRDGDADDWVSCTHVGRSLRQVPPYAPSGTGGPCPSAR